MPPVVALDGQRGGLGPARRRRLLLVLLLRRALRCQQQGSLSTLLYVAVFWGGRLRLNVRRRRLRRRHWQLRFWRLGGRRLHCRGLPGHVLGVGNWRAARLWLLILLQDQPLAGRHGGGQAGSDCHVRSIDAHAFSDAGSTSRHNSLRVEAPPGPTT